MARQPSFIVFVSLQYKENPSIEGRNFSPCENIPVIDEIFVPGKENDDPGSNQLIVYQPGNKTIFTDKTLGEIKETKDFAREPINLIDGHLFVDTREALLIQYLRASNYNLANENRMPDKRAIFKERDKAQDAQKFLDEDLKIHQIKNKIHFTYDPDELSALALILGDTYAEEKDTKEIRRDLLVFCANQPEKLIEAMENPENARKVYIIRAFKGKIVEYNSRVNQINWANGGKICDVPMGQKPEDHLLYLTSQDAYSELLGHIKDRLPKPTEFKAINEEEENQPPPPQVKDPEPPAQPPAEAVAGDPPPPPTPPAPGPVKEFNMQEYMEKAVENEVFFKRGPYYCLKGTVKGDKYYAIANSYRKLGKKIKGNPELKALIDSELFSAGVQ